MSESEVCYKCSFYNKHAKDPKDRCTARDAIKKRCTYWDDKLQKIVPTPLKSITVENREQRAESRG